jgi:hypothetical protein
MKVGGKFRRRRWGGMNDQHTYEIEIRGRMEENDLNAAGPLQIAVTRTDESATALIARTDQSGLIGLLRHLHGRGAILLSVRCAE